MWPDEHCPLALSGNGQLLERKLDVCTLKLQYVCTMCNQPVLFMHVKQGQIMCPKINSKSSEQIGLTNTK